MGIIYCYTNIKTGKKYIGQTIHPEQRKRSHLHEAIKKDSQYYFHRSIRKHGWDAFTYEVLEETDKLSERETHHIKELNTLWPNGYNQLESHIGMPEDIRKKISDTKKKQYAAMTSEERKQRMNVLIEANKGSKRSEETRNKMSESAKKYLRENPRPKRIWTQEQRDKQSALLKEKYSQGIGRWSK